MKYFHIKRDSSEVGTVILQVVCIDTN